MRTISFYSNKGGATRTTSVFNISAVLAKNYGAKVLVIDTDPQANLTMRYMSYKTLENGGSYAWIDGISTIEDCFLAPQRMRKAVVEDAIQKCMFPTKNGEEPSYHNIDIICTRNKDMSETTLSNVEQTISTGSISKDVLSKVLKEVGDYDYVLIDMDSSIGPLNQMSLESSDYVVTPVHVDPNSKDGIPSFSTFFSERKSVNNNLEHLGFYSVRVNGNDSYAKELTAELEGLLGSNLFDTYTKEASQANWSLDNGIPLCWYEPGCQIAKNYVALTKEILYRIEQKEEN